MITLTKTQIEAITSKLAGLGNNETFNFDVDVTDELQVNVEGYLNITGYREDDPQNGTGAFVETGRRADVQLTGWQYNPRTEDIEEVAIDDESVKEVYNYLMAA